MIDTYQLLYGLLVLILLLGVLSAIPPKVNGKRACWLWRHNWEVTKSNNRGYWETCSRCGQVEFRLTDIM